LGKHIPVYVYILNPCEHFWFDIRSRKELLRLAEKKQKGTLIQLDAEKYQIGNPLLASQGAQVREFLGALYDKVAAVLEREPQIVRCLRVTGEACYVAEILAADMPDLARITSELARIGSVTTDLVYEVVVDRAVPA